MVHSFNRNNNNNNNKVIWCQLFSCLWSHFQNFMIKQGLLFRKLTNFHLNPYLIWNLSIFFLVLLSFFLQLYDHLPAVLCINISFVSDQSTYHLHFKQFTGSSHTISEVWLQPSDSLQLDLEHAPRVRTNLPLVW